MVLILVRGKSKTQCGAETYELTILPFLHDSGGYYFFPKFSIQESHGKYEPSGNLILKKKAKPVRASKENLKKILNTVRIFYHLYLNHDLFRVFFQHP